MTQREKRLQKFLEHPSSTSYSDIESLLLGNGFKILSKKGSHIKFRHPSLEDCLILPVHHNDLKSYYKKEAAIFLKRIL